jgi:hypothetical protein
VILKIVETCPHDVSEQDVAAQADGLCPLCLFARVGRLRDALQQIDSIGVRKKAGAGVEMQRIARAALRET